MKETNNYTEELKDIAEKLAFVGFTNHGFELLEQRGVTHEDINHFVVTMFFATYVDDNNDAEVELDVRFTVYVKAGERDNQEVTFMFKDKEIIDAIIQQKHNIEYGYAQKHEWQFPKPNPIQLFDAQLTLDETLGII